MVLVLIADLQDPLIRLIQVLPEIDRVRILSELALSVQSGDMLQCSHTWLRLLGDRT